MTYEKHLKIIAESEEVHPAEEVKPELGPFTQMLFDAFFEVSSERSIGFSGPESITSRMCMDYCQLHGIADQTFFYKAMKAADAVWLKHKAEKKPNGRQSS